MLSGYDNTNAKVGAYWINGVEQFTQGVPDATPSNFYGETYYVTRDGSTILGGTSDNGFDQWGAYRHTIANGQNENLFTPTDPVMILAVGHTSDDAQDVISGYEKDERNNNWPCRSSRTRVSGWGFPSRIKSYQLPRA